MNKKIIYIFVLFIFSHLVLLNINVAEWGDSYRILRASEIIKSQQTYPQDEKRPPLFSLVLSVIPTEFDAVFWGRIFMLVVNASLFYIFYLYSKELFHTTEQIAFSLLLLLFNPVFLYWSLRIMSDTFFALFVVAAFYVFYKNKESLYKTNTFGFLTGVLAGLSVLTRFEGYILAGSIGLVLLLKKKFKQIGLFLFGFIPLWLPWIIYRNPLASSYFEEPAGRVYDLKMAATYFISLLFLFGFTFAFTFMPSLKELKQVVKRFPAISIFVLLELLLILAWPAAVPRLFVPIVPFLVLGLTYKVYNRFESHPQRIFILVSLGLTGLYAVAQYYLKLQFLILYKPVFVVVIAINLLAISAFYKRKKIFAGLIILSMLIWTLSTIYLHKDIYKSIYLASNYFETEVCGAVTIAEHNVTSVANWYINYENPQNCSVLQIESETAAYRMVTNEHNPGTSVPNDENIV